MIRLCRKIAVADDLELAAAPAHASCLVLEGGSVRNRRQGVASPVAGGKTGLVGFAVPVDAGAVHRGVIGKACCRPHGKCGRETDKASCREKRRVRMVPV